MRPDLKPWRYFVVIGYITKDDVSNEKTYK